MCGRFVQAAKKEQLASRFKVSLPEQVALTPRYNLAPTQGAAVLTEANRRPMLDFCVWGLIPGWSSNPAAGSRLINARAETLWEKPSFRDPVRYRRCLVPANGFYEWAGERRAGKKTPYYFTVKDQPLFAFAGLWAIWADRDGGEIRSFCIVTTAADSFMKPYHHRMPLILTPDQEAVWLNHDYYRPDELAPIIDDRARPRLTARAVSARVNRVAVDDERCIEPVAEQGELL